MFLEPDDYLRMKMVGYDRHDPEDDFCVYCDEEGYAECRCNKDEDGYDPLDEPNFTLSDDQDGLTIEEVREIENDVIAQRAEDWNPYNEMAVYLPKDESEA